MMEPEFCSRVSADGTLPACLFGDGYNFGCFAVTRAMARRSCSSCMWVWKSVVVKFSGFFFLKIQWQQRLLAMRLKIACK